MTDKGVIRGLPLIVLIHSGMTDEGIINTFRVKDKE
jgi:hypothetical protein